MHALFAYNKEEIVSLIFDQKKFLFFYTISRISSANSVFQFEFLDRQGVWLHLVDGIGPLRRRQGGLHRGGGRPWDSAQGGAPGAGERREGKCLI